MNSEVELEVRLSLKQILAGKDDTERLRGATELARLGVRTRGSVRARGSLFRAAPIRLLEPADLDSLARIFQHAPDDLRCQIALVLAEWSGEHGVKVLARTLDLEPAEKVRLYCITALRTIGGAEALEALRLAAQTGSAASREAAVSGIRELVTGGSLDDTDSKPISVLYSTAEKPGLTLQTREAAGVWGIGDTINPVVDTLQQIRADKTLPVHVRLNAAETLKYFQ